MKISPMPSSNNSINGAITGPDSSQHNGFGQIRSLKMNTNATPEWQRSQAQVHDLPPAPLPISDKNDQADEEEANKPLSPQFAALAKQRRALQQERAIFEKEKAASSQSAEPGSIPKAKLLENPLQVLLEAGVTYEQLTEQILAGQGNSEVNDLKAKIAALEKGVDQKLNDRDAQSEKQALAEMRREALALSREGEDFELVRETGSINDVMTLIEKTYREDGTVLDVSEALKLVEDELLAEAEKVTGLNKVRSKFMPPPMQRQGMRTLTNRDTAQAPMSAKQRAMAAFYGTLKR